MAQVALPLQALERTSDFNECLKKHGAPPASPPSFSLERINQFLKEAYSINKRIANLHKHLQHVRQPYLSTAQPRKTYLRNRPDQTELYLNDQQREQIDAEAKGHLRDLNASIRTLEEALQLDQMTEERRIQEKYGSVISKWLSRVTEDGGKSSKSDEQVEAEERLKQTIDFRESALWFLRQGLQRCGQLQQSMMETRLTREMEKDRSVLAKAKLDTFQDLAMDKSMHGAPASNKREDATAPEAERGWSENDLTQEQLQLFEKGNQDMLKHYESTLDKVRTAEKSLLEISELQTMLVSNLEVQSSHVEQLVSDSFKTTENVDRGNKELKKALDRPSAARYTFFAAGGLCMFMIVWDLII